jgi:hypothetical protein
MVAKKKKKKESISKSVRKFIYVIDEVADHEPSSLKEYKT